MSDEMTLTKLDAGPNDLELVANEAIANARAAAERLGVDVLAFVCIAVLGDETRASTGSSSVLDAATAKARPAGLASKLREELELVIAKGITNVD